jgi:hypothetical protein
MKKTSILVLFAGVVIGLSGCVTKPDEAQNQRLAYADTPPTQAWYGEPTTPRARRWYRFRHRLWSDGYSFSNDPQNHDSLAPTLGLDSYFPPAPLAYKSVEQ